AAWPGPPTPEPHAAVVCQSGGARRSRRRLLRAIKNRFGTTAEVGCVDLTETGIEGLADPSGVFLSHATQSVPGTCVTVALEGRRALATEIQALVTPSALASPRRTTSGVDSSRLAMVLAVLQSRVRAPIGNKDVYVSTVGGSRLTEPAVDLALALATVSDLDGHALARGMVAMGEVGLSGELRRITGAGVRLAEAARLGFTKAIVPAMSVDAGQVPAGMEIVEVPHLAAAVQAAREVSARA